LLWLKSSKSWVATLLLCLFLGLFGAHRFYIGKFSTGLLWLLTFGLFFMGWLVDLVVVLSKGFRDKHGSLIV
jgi:TM2 domain-containing membrane protein YozV